jgi:CAAX protease family protein
VIAMPEPPPAPLPDDPVAARLRGFGPLGTVTALVIAALGPVLEPLGGVLVLFWAVRSRTPWRALGFVTPVRWPRTLLIGITSGVALKLAMKSLVMPLLGAPVINPAYHHLVGNTAAVPGMVVDMIVGAGFAEEAVFRGFAFERLGRLLGRGAGARAITVAMTALWFGAVHYPGQGLAGAEQATITGLVFGTVFAVTGRLWVPMVAHAAFDLTALGIIYWDLESRVAHLIFR